MHVEYFIFVPALEKLHFVDGLVVSKPIRFPGSLGENHMEAVNTALPSAILLRLQLNVSKIMTSSFIN